MSATFMPNGRIKFFDIDARVLAGGKVYTYAAGTNVPKATYYDEAATVLNTNPVILDVRGEAVMRWQGAYKYVVRDANDVLVYEIDNFTVPTDLIRADFSSVNGAANIGFQLDAPGAVPRDLLKRGRDYVFAADFGIKMDNTDETAKFQAAIAYIQQPGAPKKLIIGAGAGLGSIISAGLFINVGGVTIEWEANTILLKKRYNGAVFVLTAGFCKFVNPGIEGGGNLGFTGSAIRVADVSFLTYDICIENPRVRDTLDSCIVFNGPRGGAGSEIRGGSLIPYNPSGVSGAGPAGIRMDGPADNDASPRKITDVDSSSSPLIDLTGMQTTFIKGGQCATILFDGNPNVSGAAYYSAKAAITGVRIRDGMQIAGQDHTFSANCTGGLAPGQLVWGWIFKANAANCRAGSSNDVVNKIADSAAGQGDNTNRFFADNIPYSLQWTATPNNPVLNDGTVIATYSVKNREVTVDLYIALGAATTLGLGSWEFSVPYPIRPGTGQGTARMLQGGGGGVQVGVAVTTNTGTPSRFMVTPCTTTNGLECSGTVPFAWNPGGFIQIQFTYERA